MLIRVTLFAPAAVRERVERLLPASEVLISRGPSDASLASAAARSDADLLLIERRRLGRKPADAMRELSELPGRPEPIVLCDREDAEERATLLAAGCRVVINTTLSDDVLRDTLRSLVARRREAATSRLSGRPDGDECRLSDFVSESATMVKFMSIARRVTASDTSLLLLGETGVGKERLARAIHAEGPRARGPFIAVNCGALPDGLLESELFGHQEGAFTGASRSRRGYFELAHTGSLFLDEIGDMPLPLQVRLLRVLQERSFQPVGSERTIEVDVRVIAATHRDLQAEIAANRFRLDLFYRLNVVALTIPPLRDRRGDVPALVRNNLEDFAKRFSRPVLRIAPAAMQALVDYSWPGNVRELINVIERAVLLCDGDEIGPSDLPESIARQGAAPSEPWSPLAGRLAAELLLKPLAAARADVVASFERRYLEGLLVDARGRIGETARRAGLSPRALFTKMKRFGLRKEDFRRPPAEPKLTLGAVDSSMVRAPAAD